MTGATMNIIYTYYLYKMNRMTQNLESEWETLLNNVSPDAGDFVAQQIATIIQSKIYGYYPNTLMTNLINNYKNGIRHDNILLELSSLDIETRFENLLHTVNPQYGDPIANEIAEILEIKYMGINVNALQLNVLKKRNTHTSPSQPHIIDISDSDE